MQLNLTRSPLTPALEQVPGPTTIRAVASGRHSYSVLFARLANWTPHWIIGRDERGAVQASVQFLTSLHWLFLRWRWVVDPHRGLGIGSRLLSGPGRRRVN
jgi:hypothetical protein